mmetsp:Transcript_77775/g.174060  ORF Transcript_77775/g.174060 Transcript_77775/m.174060 type:complete len:357 (-) Transcript_77775:230-1300(-)
MVVQRRGSACSGSSPGLRTGSESAASQAEFDPSKLHKYAQAAPKFPPTGDQQIDARLALRRVALMRIVDHLLTHTDEILECWANLSGGQCKPQADAAEQGWDRTVATFARLPKYWKAQLLTSVDGTHGTEPCLEQADLDELDKHDRDLVHNTFYMHLMVPKTVALPFEMRNDKGLCALVCKARCVSVGGLRGWKARCFSDGGKFDPKKATCYEFVWGEAGRATTISWFGEKDKTKAVTVPITQDFDIIDPYDPWKAMATDHQAAEYYLYKFWAEGEGPRAFCVPAKKITDQLMDIIKETNSGSAEEVKQLKADTIKEENPDFVGAARGAMKQEALSKAAAKSRASEKRRRTLSLKP